MVTQNRWFAAAVVLAFVLGLLVWRSVQAAEIVTARVTLVEPTYMPSAVSFQIDKPLPSCPLGSWLSWNKGPDNNRAVYAALLSAMNSGKRITLYINNGDTTCAGQYLHVLKD